MQAAENNTGNNSCNDTSGSNKKLHPVIIQIHTIPKQFMIHSYIFASSPHSHLINLLMEKPCTKTEKSTTTNVMDTMVSL